MDKSIGRGLNRAQSSSLADTYWIERLQVFSNSKSQIVGQILHIANTRKISIAQAIEVFFVATERQKIAPYLVKASEEMHIHDLRNLLPKSLSVQVVKGWIDGYPYLHLWHPLYAQSNSQKNESDCE